MKIEKISRIGRESLLNSAHLIRDSIILFKKGSYSSAAFLATIAVEELGKFVSIDNFVHHHKIDRKLTESEIDKYVDQTFKHKWKQAQFFRNHFGSLKKGIYWKFLSGEVDEEKQKCLYVGVVRGKYSGKIFVPREKNKNRVEDIVNFAHYLVLDQVRDIANGSYDETIGGFKMKEMRNLYKDLFYMWDLNYKSVVIKKDWDFVRTGFNHLNDLIGIRYVD